MTRLIVFITLAVLVALAAAAAPRIHRSLAERKLQLSNVLPVHPFTGLRAVGIVRGRPVWPIMGADETGENEIRTRLVEIDERMETVRTELLTFADRDLDDTEATRFDELETEYTALDTEREPLARRAATLDRVREQQRSGRGLERGAGTDERRRTVDPYADLEQVRSNSLAATDLRSRALAAIEQVPDYMLEDDQRERAQSLLQRSDRHGRIARHMLLTGSEDYLRAFEGILSGLQPWQLDADAQRALNIADEHRRAMAEGTGAAGGYLVPFFLDPTIILTNAGTTNPFRQIARQVSITTQAWHGVSSAGVTAEWLAEATEVSDHSPTFAQPVITPQKAASWLQASFEVTEDTNIASEVGMLLADAKDQLEANAFAVGSGSGQPKGVVTAVSAVSGSKVAAGTDDTYAVTDVYNLAAALPPRYRKNASWVMNDSIILKTRQFASGSGPQHAFWADLGMDNPPELLGKSLYESSAMDGVIDASAHNYIALLGDFRQFVIVDRIGMTVQFEPLVKGANRRPTGEVGWFAHWRVGSDVTDPNAFRLLDV